MPSPSGTTTHLFIPAADPLETMWSVAPPTLEEARKTLDASEISHTTDLPANIDQIAQMENAVLHVLPRTVEFPALPAGVDALGDMLCDKYLLEACQIARIRKDEAEIDLIREANRISSSAHEVLMRELGRFAGSRGQKPAVRDRTLGEGIEKWQVESEGDAEALFVATCRRAGAAQAYLPIVASGSHASTLHYV